MKKEEKFVLDSFALLAFFQKEPGWKFIQKLFYRLAQQKKTALFICISTALRHNAVIITGDPEFSEVRHIVTIKWLPSLS